MNPELKAAKEKYYEMMFAAASILWAAAPESRKGMAYDFALAFGHTWAVAASDIDGGAYLPLTDIRAAAEASCLQPGITYPECVIGEMFVPCYKHTTGSGRITVEIPFEGDVAAIVTINRPNGGKVKGYLDEYARLRHTEVSGPETKWYLRHEEAWGDAISGVFFNIAEIPAFPAPIEAGEEPDEE